ncbi:hypothetical protein MKS88_000807 [Plasmodium brasilianum]|uniref:Uncharacterized protein n=1 Tax=Plasmodium brasilianum TaxID=5824 RepID=A0ACB9YGV8_PLABR|nr:hypothetical protein MKS88_000807 [Plasmodium brasilianum]
MEEQIKFLSFKIIFTSIIYIKSLKGKFKLCGASNSTSILLSYSDDEMMDEKVIDSYFIKNKKRGIKENFKILLKNIALWLQNMYSIRLVLLAHVILKDLNIDLYK